MNVLVLNCGSSSAKFAVINSVNGQEPLRGSRSGSAPRTRRSTGRSTGRSSPRTFTAPSHDIALRAVVELLDEAGSSIDSLGVGHRVVHGGAKFSGSIPITQGGGRQDHASASRSARSTTRSTCSASRSRRSSSPRCPQVAVFDTAFHQTMPPRAYLYAVPYEWFEKHEVRRYGFHGTSHRYVSQQAVKQLGLDPEDHAIVTAHLGNGCSLAAVRNGAEHGHDDGPHAARGRGDGHAQRHHRPVDHRPHEEGSCSCSTEDGDGEAERRLRPARHLRRLEGHADAPAGGAGRARARALAIDKFCYSVAKAAAGMFVSLGRVDALVFTGGIGENQAEVRAQIVELLAFAGFSLDPPRTRSTGARSTAGSRAARARWRPSSRPTRSS